MKITKLNSVLRKVCIWSLGFAMLMTMSGCTKGGFVGNKKNTDEMILYFSEPDNIPMLKLQFPEELSEYVIREQSTYGLSTTEAFYIKNSGDDIPMFRIDVGDEKLGDWLGVFKTDKGEIPVTYTVFTVSEDDIASLGENGRELYDELMRSFNILLETVFNDPRFSFDKQIDVGESHGVAMTYWTIELPDKMLFSENTSNGNYEAVFYTVLNGENVKLYTVCIGEEMAETQLGYFEIAGVKKPISVGSFDLSENYAWTEDDYAVAYRMMDTINDVIEVIMSSKQFSLTE